MIVLGWKTEIPAPPCLPFLSEAFVEPHPFWPPWPTT
ncbi:hypothetical protein Ab1vBOLIVR5_gp112 [Agrobacterium phage OLIVR5]|uniref:Uncharacterized protein n=1 Tax=Agrobacterium phage OLIVR5 TaxID=2723773 RepID=A0A858MV04_9CAUD|nr:hypothetical protein KNU99_gp112 [Agrobacterium phage OLIVR5]QIW87760.1 hypothetical protein Ab1vBOLIVR5_gp112 [Agrobacterium phage OLIVR5]QIW88022.1 hypothetical protein Ab1vBOLIVR6_gp115 [Agrobacterium phage OLIVR6]